MRQIERWKAFWDAQCAPLHAEDSDAFYRAYAREVALLLPEQPGRTLDVGCGNGALYPYLAERFGDYTGVDYSASMLGVFRQKHPNLKLIQEDGSRYRDDSRYGLVFCNGVAQNFSPAMMERFLDNAAAMLRRPGGVCFLGMLPDRRLRFGFTSGYLRAPAAAGPLWKNVVRYVRDGLTGRDGIGFWFDAGRLTAQAAAHGFSCRIYGSMLYRYRFHAVLGAGEAA